MPDSRFEERFDCEQMECLRVDLNGSNLKGIQATGLVVTGGVFLHKINTNATITLNRAKIGDRLEFSSAEFETSGYALNADGAEVSGSIVLDEIKTNAEIVLSSATIGGQVNCSNIKFKIKKGRALNAQNIKVSGGFFGATYRILKVDVILMLRKLAP